jgi:hypothetical protein
VRGVVVAFRLVVKQMVLKKIVMCGRDGIKTGRRNLNDEASKRYEQS